MLSSCLNIASYLLLTFPHCSLFLFIPIHLSIPSNPSRKILTSPHSPTLIPSPPLSSLLQPNSSQSAPYPTSHPSHYSCLPSSPSLPSPPSFPTLPSLLFSHQYKSQLDQAAAEDHLRDAHVWWSYVWHELKRQSTSHFPPGGGNLDQIPGEFGTVSLFENDSQAQIVSNKLRESLRSSAIMLASARQVSVCVCSGGVECVCEIGCCVTHANSRT